MITARDLRLVLGERTILDGVSFSVARGESVATLVRMSVAELEQVAAILEPLPPDRWQRQGRHPELGAMSIEFLAQRAAEHAVEHARQVADTARLL